MHAKNFSSKILDIFKNNFRPAGAYVPMSQSGFPMCIMLLSNLECVFLSEKCLYLINNVIECLYYITLETCQDASYGLYKCLKMITRCHKKVPLRFRRDNMYVSRHCLYNSRYRTKCLT
jgi:hypothetical protein